MSDASMQVTGNPCKEELPNGNGTKPELVLSDFTYCGFISKGATCSVKLYTHKQVKYAVKILKQEQLIAKNQISQALRERKALLDIRNSGSTYLEKLKAVFKDNQNLYFVVNYAGAGALHRHIRSGPSQRLSMEQARFYTAELVSALDTLHTKLSVVYRDLKANNVVIQENGHILLVDYGFAKQLDDTTNFRTYTFCGTRHSMAPEMLHKDQSQNGHSFEVDWWGLGVLIFEMIAGTPPWPYFFPNQVSDIPKYDACICQGLKSKFFETVGWENSDIHDAARAVVEQLLSIHPENRTVVPIKSFEWFSKFEPKVNWDDIDQGKHNVPAFNLTLGEFESTQGEEKSDKLTQDEQDLFAGF